MAGQSDSNMSLFSPGEIEFMAEDELVEIVPNLRMDSLNFICGDYVPFHPQLAAQVPLWLAVALKKRGKCTIRPPQWMSIENLAQVLELERDSHAFQPLPFHYLEISRLLFDHAREDIPDMYMVNLYDSFIFFSYVFGINSYLPVHRRGIVGENDLPYAGT
ncbi:hypothetical protein H0E87_016367 [Populus deltoides]|uniref:DNA replication complex GINS protein PSF2 N-terminal domain-containing protein n=1 Tax=Populus deltoides TaxID=3696 RepID=A0A8T2Y8S1_POPDE|nr:hypothetical protein H0E87_016367 [Populus deltoides]